MFSRISFAIFLSLFASSLCLNITEYELAIKKLAGDRTFTTAFEKHIQNLLEIEPNYYSYAQYSFSSFDCRILPSPSVPTSVHRLRPSDIKVIGAMGDSLTAAMGAKAKTVIGLLTEYRGVSWSMGGDRTFNEQATLPNILRMFSPYLIGFNTGQNLVTSGKQGIGLNAAVSGQEANHALDQARILIQRMKENTKIDFKNDWKLITVFVGSNDLCDFCKDKTLHSPTSFIKFITAALDLLYEQVPRAFVNLVSVINISEGKY
jgi:phospholipase B1, membrane-associated